MVETIARQGVSGHTADITVPLRDQSESLVGLGLAWNLAPRNERNEMRVQNRVTSPCGTRRYMECYIVNSREYRPNRYEEF